MPLKFVQFHQSSQNFAMFLKHLSLSLLELETSSVFTEQDTPDVTFQRWDVCKNAYIQQDENIILKLIHHRIHHLKQSIPEIFTI